MIGASGSLAAKMLTVAESKLLPTELLAVTLNLYVVPAVSGTVVK